MFGDVVVRLSHGATVEGTLLEFTPIPIPVTRTVEGKQVTEHKVIIYGVVESKEDGSFFARQLSEIKRTGFKF